MSSSPLYIGGGGGYGQGTSEVGEGPALPSISSDEIEAILGKRINVALIDCEGCIPQIDKTNLLDETEGVDLILMEEDANPNPYYGEWHKVLQQRNVSDQKNTISPATYLTLVNNWQYNCVWYLEDTHYHKHPESKRWSMPMRHSVWLHKRAMKSRVHPGSCSEYINERGFTSGQIVCAECPSPPSGR